MRYLSGKLLILIGLVHCTVGIVFGHATFAEMIAEGLFNAVEPDLRRMY